MSLFATRRAGLLMTSALAAFALPGLAAAQEAATNSDVGVLEELVVTASKRETKLMQTPLAISAFTQESLDRQGIKSARDLSATMPNVQLSTGADSGTAASIRGVTSTDFTEVGEGAVAIHQDGFYSPRSQGALALMFDVERVEVLRGPQGTLFGMNSPAGAINIIPAKPSFNDTFGKVEGELGNYNARGLRGSFNWGVSDTFALRAAFMVEQHDGYMVQEQDFTDIESPAYGIHKDGIPDVDQRRNRLVKPKDYYNNADQWAARLIGRWRPTDKLEFTGTVSRFSDQGAGDLDFVDCKQAAGTVNACNHPQRYAKINVPGSRDMTVDDFQLKVAYDVFDKATLEYRGAYQDQKRDQISDVDGGAHPNPLWSSIGDPSLTSHEAELTGYYPIWDEVWSTKGSRYRTTSHEVQLKSNGASKFQYVLGAYYLKENKRIRYDMEMLANKTWTDDPHATSYDPVLGFQPDGLPDTWIFDQNKRTTESKALFGQFDYRVLPKVNLTAGYRYSWDRKTDQGGVTYAFWEGSSAWYNGHHTPDSIRGHQSNDLNFDMGGEAPLGVVVPGGAPNNVAMKWKQGTYRLGAQYFQSDDVMWFASLATGYKMGGMYEMFDTCNNGCLSLLTYDPEKVKTFELGYKATLLEGRMRLSVTGFYSDYTDMQNTGDKVVGTDTNPLSANFGDPVLAWTTDNLNSARIQGVEVEFDIIPWAHGRLSGYGAFLDTKIKNGGTFTDGFACAEREILNVAHCGAPGYDTIVGNQLPFAPKYSMSVTYEHSFDLKSGYALQPYVQVRWQDRMWMDVQNLDLPHLTNGQAAYAKVNASLKLTAPQNQFYVELFGDNLTDKDTKNFGGFNRGVIRGTYDPPRTWGVRLGYSF
ncbi:TonB-dependent receptor [Caulobacter sp.]|uniref:TonB-dependent receptor n=1 Tax=Caulobacter sp. TaxID=78 RepID=UPI0025BD7EF5|nr:TonB-dependent receptor [Caulobacter sp.]